MKYKTTTLSERGVKTAELDLDIKPIEPMKPPSGNAGGKANATAPATAAKPKRLKIVVYAIAHNEAKFARRWMDSMKEADEIVVLDTGSTDGTPDKLRALGAKVETKRYAKWNSIAEYKRVMAAKKETPWRFDWAH